MKGDRQKLILRLVRFGLLGACLVMLYLLMDRFELYTLQEDSMTPAYRVGTRLLLDLEPRSPRRGDTVLYAFPRPSDKKLMARVARIAALGGDRLKVKEQILYVAGERSLHRIPAGRRIPAQVPPGQLYLLNDNPQSLSPDSLSHGPIQPGSIRARVVTSIDFF